MKKSVILLAVMTLMALPVGIRAQNAAPETARAENAKPADHFYKLNLTVQETNEAGKVVNGRTFVATIETSPGFSQSIRTGDKVPIETSANQYSYLDLGVDFDIALVKEIGNSISFRLTANVSSYANPMRASNGGAEPSNGGSQPSSDAANRPVIRQNRWDSGVLIPVGKPTVVFSADDLQGKGKMQVEVTATRID